MTVGLIFLILQRNCPTESGFAPKRNPGTGKLPKIDELKMILLHNSFLSLRINTIRFPCCPVIITGLSIKKEVLGEFASFGLPYGVSSA
jgi:hypothetical protein